MSTSFDSGPEHCTAVSIASKGRPNAPAIAPNARGRVAIANESAIEKRPPPLGEVSRCFRIIDLLYWDFRRTAANG